MIYEFQCEECLRVFEKKLTIKGLAEFRETRPKCECGGDVNKRFSGVNFRIERNPPPEAFDERHGGQYPLPRHIAEQY